VWVVSRFSRSEVHEVNERPAVVLISGSYVYSVA